MSNYLNTSEGVLVRLKDLLNKALNVNPETLRLMIDKYISVRYGRVSTKSHFDKVNAYNELNIDKMTIKVFFKYLRIIQVKKVKFTITVTTARDKEVTISEDFNIFIDRQQGDNDD